MKFRDRVVIVTGAANGIGKAVAEGFGKEGAKVVIADLDEEKGNETGKAIRLAGGEAIFVKTDVKVPAEITGLISEAVIRFGTIDILVNNAGISQRFSPYDVPVEVWDKIINTNLRSTFLCSREAARIMKSKGGGIIINIASTRAFMSEPNMEAYAASKGGIVALTHALASSFAPDHIRVNCISPGWIETGDYSKLNDSDHRQHFSGRVGKPEDIARACMFLAGDDNDFINGANLIIDGGMTRKMIYEE